MIVALCDLNDTVKLLVCKIVLELKDRVLVVVGKNIKVSNFYIFGSKIYVSVYQEIRMGEDNAFVFECLYVANSVYFCTNGF